MEFDFCRSTLRGSRIAYPVKRQREALAEYVNLIITNKSSLYITYKEDRYNHIHGTSIVA